MLTKLLAGAALLPGLARAQSVHDEWRTVRTEHYRVHYPVEAEAWALQAAGKLDAIRERVAREVGHEPDKVVDIIVLDPFNDANGFALPLLGRPRMGIFPTAPGADSVIGNYRSWSEKLLTHEETHLDHLLWPSRNPLDRAVGAVLLGVGPLTLKSPGWVIEGYATLVEGRLTGGGRPHSDGRAAFIRMLAQDGELPTYEQLAGSQRWRGGSVPYLVGSAFLEWLDARAPEPARPDTRAPLVKLWNRLAARKRRSFDDAFAGVFGDPPRTLYARFTAEVTHQALEIERRRPADEGTLWADLAWSTGALAVSPDGERIAVVVRSRTMPARLVVWSTAEPTEAREKWEESIDETLERDAEDAPPTSPRTFEREELAHRVAPDRPAEDLRWLPDGQRILFSSFDQEPDGDYVSDLFTWDWQSGRERRVTRFAGLRDADPHPSGTWAIAVHQRWGINAVARVDLESGDVTYVTEPSAEIVYDSPRISPDGERAAWLQNDGAWHVVVRDGERTEVVPLPAGHAPVNLAWSADGGSLVLSLGHQGFIEVFAVDPASGDARQLTRSRGGAFQPEPTPDGEALFYLSPDAFGLDVHRLDLARVQEPVDLGFAPEPPVVPLPPRVVEPPESRPFAKEPRPYGAGRMSLRPLVGSTIGPGSGAVEAGFALGDVIGRSQVVGIGSWGGAGGVGGGRLALRWRGAPVEVGLDGFAEEESDLEIYARTGGELSLSARRDWSRGRAALSLGGWADTALHDYGLGDRAAAFLRPALSHRTWFGPFWLGFSAEADGQAGHTAPGDYAVGGVSADAVATPAAASWTRGDGRVEAGGGWLGLGLLGSWRAGGTSSPAVLDQYRLGGSRTSVHPSGWAGTRLREPALQPGWSTGPVHDDLRLTLDAWGIALFGSRHRFWGTCEATTCTSEGGPRATTLAGLGLSAPLPAQPLVGTPAGLLEAGVACILETPEGLADRPCQDLGDYAGWIGITWTP